MGQRAALTTETFGAFNMEHPFYILDCNGDKVGNVKGYATMRGACQVANRWDVYESCLEKLNRLQRTKPNATVVTTVKRLKG